MVLGCEMLRGQGFPINFRVKGVSASGKHVTIPDASRQPTAFLSAFMHWVGLMAGGLSRFQMRLGSFQQF